MFEALLSTAASDLEDDQVMMQAAAASEAEVCWCSRAVFFLLVTPLTWRVSCPLRV